MLHQDQAAKAQGQMHHRFGRILGGWPGGRATQQKQPCSLPVTKLRDALEQPVVRLALDAELASDVCSTPKLRAQQAQPVSRFLTWVEGDGA